MKGCVTWHLARGNTFCVNARVANVLAITIPDPAAPSKMFSTQRTATVRTCLVVGVRGGGEGV